MPITGINISQHDGDVDFQKINALPLSFMYIRAAYSKIVDAALDRNVHGAMSIKMPFGLYYEVKPQYNWKIQAEIHAGIEEDYGGGKLPPVLWLVDDGDTTKTDLNGWTFKWIREIEEASGKNVMVFTSAPFCATQLPLTDFLWKRLLWLNDKTIPYDVPSEWKNHSKTWTLVANSSIPGSSIGSAMSKVDSSLFSANEADFIKAFGVKPKPLVQLPPGTEPWKVARTKSAANPRTAPGASSTDAGTILPGSELDCIGEPVGEYRPLKIWVHTSLLEKVS